jgi:hypothetical protein
MCFRNMLTFMLLSCEATAYFFKKMYMFQHAIIFIFLLILLLVSCFLNLFRLLFVLTLPS